MAVRRGGRFLMSEVPLYMAAVVVVMNVYLDVLAKLS